MQNVKGEHSFSTYAEFCEKPTFLTPSYSHVREILDFWNILRMR